MPTSYTAPIEDGNTNARDFVTHCARAFGAFAHQREEDIDSPPRPVEIDNDTYYTNAAVGANDKLAKLKSLSEAEIQAGWQKHFDEVTQSNIDSILRHREMVAKYQAVKNKVEAWEPNEEATPLKEYCLDQIKISWPYDPWIMEPHETPEEWYDRELKCAEKDVKYYADQLQSEQESFQERREYGIKMLESIKDVAE